jgi:prevent-host-death family protein
VEKDTMKFVPVHEAKASLSSFLEECQREHVVITKHGKLCAVLKGVEGYDLEDLLMAGSPKFWRMIEDRRRRPGRGLTLEEARKHFAAKEAPLPPASKRISRRGRRRPGS